MKSFSLLNYSKLLLIALVVTLSAVSCNKDDDDEKDPVYLGTWSRTETVIIDEFELDVKDIMTFTKNSVTNLGQIYNPLTEEWIDLMGLKGSLSVDGNSMDVTVDEIGFSDTDLDGLPTGDMTYYDSGDPEFDALLNEFELEENFEAEYSVAGNQLTLKTDDNSDGDFNDEGETAVYTKE